MAKAPGANLKKPSYMQASSEPASRALFPSGVITMAIRGAIEVVVMDNLRPEDFRYAHARMGSWAVAPA